MQTNRKKNNKVKTYIATCYSNLGTINNMKQSRTTTWCNTRHHQQHRVPKSSTASFKRPMDLRWEGVVTERAITSPTASWNPGLAPLRNKRGWFLNWRKYCTWPISWWTTTKSSMTTCVHWLTLGEGEEGVRSRVGRQGMGWYSCVGMVWLECDIIRME